MKKLKNKFLMMIMIFLVSLSFSVSADMYRFASTAETGYDNSMFSYSAFNGGSAGTCNILRVGFDNSPYLNRALVNFTTWITNGTLDGKIIKNVSWEIVVDSSEGDIGCSEMTIYPLNQSWGEDDGVCFHDGPTYASWNKPLVGESWGAPGAQNVTDYNGTWDVLVGPPITIPGKQNLTLDIVYFQALLDGTIGDYDKGLILIDKVAEVTGEYDVCAFSSSDDEGWILWIEADEIPTPPTFSNQIKNTTPYYNQYIEMNITITETNASHYKFFWNNTGSFVNDTEQTYTDDETVSTIKQVTVAHQNICWGYWANDTDGSSDVSSLDCFTVQNYNPTIAITSPYDGDRDNINLTVDYTPSDAESDSLICYLYINDVLNMTNTTPILDSSNIFTTTEMLSTGSYPWYVNCTDNYGGQFQSTERTYHLDLTPPLLDVYSPLNNSWYEETDTFDLNISGEDPNIYLLNYTMFNSTGDILQSNQVENSSGSQTYLSINDTIDISAFGFGNGDKIYINISTSDLHTDSDISDTKKGKKGETEFLVNNSDDSIQYGMSAYFVEKEDKLTDTPGDINSYFEYNDDNTKINFGFNFTVIKPETKPVFNVTVQGATLKYISDSGYRGHIIWYPYGTDFEGTLLVNGIEETYTVDVLVIDDNNIVVKIIPDENLAGNDLVELRFDSIFGLNIVERQYVVNVGSTSAPVLSGINCTSNPSGDTTERYDTYGDLTPTFDATTDIDSYGWISSDNSTWVICTTTGSTSHTCTLPSEQELGYENQSVYVLFNNSYYDNKLYDVWDSFTGYYLSGTVKDDDGRLINNAYVHLMLNGTTYIKYTTYTNASGGWDVGMPISGEIYTVTAYDPLNQTLGADAEAWIEVT